MAWPDDTNGDVFRRLANDGFDFSRKHTVDFNVDFESWPPIDKALAAIRASYPDTTLYPPESGGIGYVLVRVHDILTYELIVRVLEDLADRTAEFGGVCESWGVLNDRAQSK